MDEITEFEYLDPDQVDGVQSAANGAPFLMLKALEGECATCHGTGKIRGGSTDCPDCGSSAEAEKAAFLEQYPEPLDDYAVKFVSAADRKKMAAAGVAMPNGDFPIPDEGHLTSAIGRLSNYRGDKAKAKAHIIKRARALDLTHRLPEEWHVSKATSDADPEPDEGQTRELHPNAGAVRVDAGHEQGNPGPQSFTGAPAPAAGSDGQGTVASDKAVPKGEALYQTGALTRKADLTGDKAPEAEQEQVQAEGDAQSQSHTNRRKPKSGQTADEGKAEASSRKAKRKVSMQNPDIKSGGDADNKPQSLDWEHKDAALAEAARNLLEQATTYVAEFEAREKAEVGKAIFQPFPHRSEENIRRAAELLRGLTDGMTARANATKEIDDMTADELIKLLDQRDKGARKNLRKERKAARAKALKKAQVNEARVLQKAAADPEWAKARQAKLDAKAAKKAAKAAVPAVDVSGITSALDDIRTKVTAIGDQKAPTRVMSNSTGVEAGLTAPVVRGQEAPNAFKALQDRIDSAKTPQERQRLGAELLKAKAISAERVRAAAPRSPGEPTPLLAR